MNQILRYAVKFTNGYWKVFDNEQYKDVQLHLLEKSAVEEVTRLNQGK